MSRSLNRTSRTPPRSAASHTIRRGTSSGSSVRPSVARNTGLNRRWRRCRREGGISAVSTKAPSGWFRSIHSCMRFSSSRLDTSGKNVIGRPPLSGQLGSSIITEEVIGRLYGLGPSTVASFQESPAPSRQFPGFAGSRQSLVASSPWGCVSLRREEPVALLPLRNCRLAERKLASGDWRMAAVKRPVPCQSDPSNKRRGRA